MYMYTCMYMYLAPKPPLGPSRATVATERTGQASPLLCCSIQYNISYNTILYYTILHYTTLYYTILYHTILRYAILYHTIGQAWGPPRATARCRQYIYVYIYIYICICIYTYIYIYIIVYIGHSRPACSRARTSALPARGARSPREYCMVFIVSTYKCVTIIS